MGTKILKISTFFPKNVLSNEQLSYEFKRWDPEKIENKVGVKIRHIVGDNETAADLAFHAANKVLDNYDKQKIDMLILCTQSPDYFLPTTACILQELLGLRTDIGAFDFNLGCSGYIYGLAMAKAFINTNIAKNVLLITAETYTKHINHNDLANRTIFGDAAAATIIEQSDGLHIYEFVFGTDGKGKDNLIVPNGCFRNKYEINPVIKTTNAGDQYTDNDLFMNGPEIFNFTIEKVPIAVTKCLEKNSLTIEDIDYFVFHQANKFMIEYLRKKIKIPKEKFYINILNTGNTVSSTIPIAMADALQNGLIKLGDKVLLCGFGVGYSWGAVIIEI